MHETVRSLTEHDRNATSGGGLGVGCLVGLGVGLWVGFGFAVGRGVARGLAVGLCVGLGFGFLVGLGVATAGATGAGDMAAPASTIAGPPWPDQLARVKATAPAATIEAATVARPSRTRARLACREARARPGATDPRTGASAGSGGNISGPVGTVGQVGVGGGAAAPAVAAAFRPIRLYPFEGALEGVVVAGESNVAGKPSGWDAVPATAAAAALRRPPDFAGASASANGTHARHAPAVRFQQFGHTACAHVGQARMDPPSSIWSRCAPQCSQNMDRPSARPLMGSSPDDPVMVSEG